MVAMRGEEFERLYAEHAAALLAFLTFRTGDRVRAEDLTADTFERILRKRWSVDVRRGSAKTGIFAIALNLLRDDARRRDAESRALQRAGTISITGAFAGSTDFLDDREALAAALDALAPQDREIVALRYGGDLTVPEIAKLTRQTDATVRGRLYRALARLRVALDEPAAA
jgi:RNA polymerase sigma-70 factor, ECF subfamily